MSELSWSYIVQFLASGAISEIWNCQVIDMALMTYCKSFTNCSSIQQSTQEVVHIATLTLPN